jgi:hypothetical protein
MIAAARARIAAELAAEQAPWSVLAYKPDSANDVPCVVVDRPRVAVNVQHHVFTFPVVVVGRRDGTQDAQAELDDVTDWVARALAGPDLVVTSIDPVTASVADLTYPAYQVTVTHGSTEC